uniref:Uncharacterized protein n=1 Tax=Plectus sambesii TaxID=2011161 RepID=A0A914VA17_9BILA
MPSILLAAIYAAPIATAVIVIWLKSRKDKAVRMAAKARDIDGKVVIITGANCGIGYATVAELAKRGAVVVLACRNLATGQAALNQLSHDVYGNDKAASTGKLHLLRVDLNSLQSVQDFSREFKSQFDRLDMLINNAGIMGKGYALSTDGFEQHFAVNHLGHFYLTNLLMDMLKKTKGSRIINVSSGYYLKATSADFEDLTSVQSPSGFKPMQAYARSKLANCLHVVELCNRLKNEQVSVFALRPGFVRGTQLGRHFNQFLLTLATPLIWFFSKDVNQGIQTVLHCALADDKELESGALYNDCRKEEYSMLVSDDNARKLWNLSEQLVSSKVKQA